MTNVSWLPEAEEEEEEAPAAAICLPSLPGTTRGSDGSQYLE